MGQPVSLCATKTSGVCVHDHIGFMKPLKITLLAALAYPICACKADSIGFA